MPLGTRQCGQAPGTADMAETPVVLIRFLRAQIGHLLLSLRGARPKRPPSPTCSPLHPPLLVSLWLLTCHSVCFPDTAEWELEVVPQEHGQCLTSQHMSSGWQLAHGIAGLLDGAKTLPYGMIGICLVPILWGSSSCSKPYAKEDNSEVERPSFALAEPF